MFEFVFLFNEASGRYDDDEYADDDDDYVPEQTKKSFLAKFPIFKIFATRSNSVTRRERTLN